jgi:hypothetical protein
MVYFRSTTQDIRSRDHPGSGTRDGNAYSSSMNAAPSNALNDQHSYHPGPNQEYTHNDNMRKKDKIAFDLAPIDTRDDSCQYKQFLPKRGSDDTLQQDLEGDGAGKSLIIFTIDITFLSPLMKYFVLASGMLLFMCLYGYFQELVVYGWFNRKLSIFCTFLHFLGCSFFAQLQYSYSKKSTSTSSGSSSSSTSSSSRYSPHGNKRSPTGLGSSLLPSTYRSIPSEAFIYNLCGPSLGGTINGIFGGYLGMKICAVVMPVVNLLRSVVFTMGTAPPGLAFGYYSLLVFLKTATQVCICKCICRQAVLCFIRYRPHTLTLFFIIA